MTTSIAGEYRRWDGVGLDAAGQRVVDTGPCPNDRCYHRVYLTFDMAEKVYERGSTFRCPDGHPASWPPQTKRDRDWERLERAEAEAAKERERAAAAKLARDRAARTCPWPTCDGRMLASPKGLRQHMVKAHGAPWAMPEVSADEIGQVLNGADPVDVVR